MAVANPVEKMEQTAKSTSSGRGIGGKATLEGGGYVAPLEAVVAFFSPAWQRPSLQRSSRFWPITVVFDCNQSDLAKEAKYASLHAAYDNLSSCFLRFRSTVELTVSLLRQPATTVALEASVDMVTTQNEVPEASTSGSTTSSSAQVSCKRPLPCNTEAGPSRKRPQASSDAVVPMSNKKAKKTVALRDKKRNPGSHTDHIFAQNFVTRTSSHLSGTAEDIDDA
ncbi:hypothetical protein JCM21900_004292 [Sporobolomyces salmonicolor]